MFNKIIIELNTSKYERINKLINEFIQKLMNILIQNKIYTIILIFNLYVN